MNKFNKDFSEMEKKVVDGDFLEGETVTVSIDGKEYTRKVRYERECGDLTITVKGYKFFASEFTY